MTQPYKHNPDPGFQEFRQIIPAVKQQYRSHRVTPKNPFIEFKKEEIEQSIPSRFEQQVSRYPRQIAVKSQTQQFTYEDLNRTANRVAHQILETRGKVEKSVLLLLENDAALIAAILAVLKVGKIYVPLDRSHPLPRLNDILEDSQAKLIITNTRNAALANKLASNGVQCINLDELRPDLSVEDLDLRISPDATAYILYTSGSTGRPKGVVQNHRTILYKTMTYTNDLHFSGNDRIAVLSPCTFSLSVGFVFGALLNGASVYPLNVRDEGLGDVANWLIEEGITVYNSVPAVFRKLTDTLSEEIKFPKLRLIHLGGEPVTATDVALYRNHFSPDCILLHHFGCNEAGTIAQYFIDHSTAIYDGIVPSGYAVEGAEILILNDAGEKAGSGSIGQIALKSRYLSPGYWHRPELTQAAFLADPRGSDDRIYLTGDLGLLLSDGCLIYYGRQDFQFKINGQRIELGEIERTLLSHPKIYEAAVAASEEVDDSKSEIQIPKLVGKRLVAYVVSNQNETPTARELGNFLREKLPDYMLPAAFVFLDALPRAANGKIDRSSLPQPDAKRELEKAFVAPRTPVEEILARIWAEILKLDKVGIHDNFFDLGGHSLLATQVVSRIREILPVDLPLRAIFEAPTVAGLAEVLLEDSANRASIEKTVQVLLRVDQLPDSEVDTLLSEKSVPRSENGIS